MLRVKISPNDRNNPPGKLADAELHFADSTCPACNGDRELTIALSGSLSGAVGRCATCEGHGVLLGSNMLAGLKLIGFAVWEPRTGGRNVTFPARQYSVNGERRSFALLRPVFDATARDRVSDLILEAYSQYEHEQHATAESGVGR